MHSFLRSLGGRTRFRDGPHVVARDPFHAVRATHAPLVVASLAMALVGCGPSSSDSLTPLGRARCPVGVVDAITNDHGTGLLGSTQFDVPNTVRSASIE